MEKTIKQIADELGIDKQKVYRYIKKNHITASSEVKQSKQYDEAAQSLIKSHFDHITTSCERYGEPHQKSGNDVVLEQLIKELDIKNEQLKEKDKQIERLQVELENAQKQTDQAQKLHAMTEQKLQLIESAAAVEEKRPEKKHWWNLKK